MLRAIIFDMDGVLVDSEPVHYKADKDMLKSQYSIDLDYEYYKQFIGGTTDNLWNTVIWNFHISGVNAAYLNSRADVYLEKMLEDKGYPAVSGVVPFVKKLKEETGLLFAVASSSSMSKINRNLKDLGLEDCFEVKVSGQDIGKSKPDPGVFLEAAKQLGVENSQCIVIEDSMNGVLAASNANMSCLGFINENSGKQDLSAATALFESFENLSFNYINMVYSHYVGEAATVLVTDRLRIREIRLSDVGNLYKLYEDEEITKYMPGLFETIEQEKEYTKNYIKNVYGFYHYGMWIIETLENNEIIGRVGVENKSEVGIDYTHELGYMIGKKYWRRGYGKEAAKAVIDFMDEEYDITDIFVEVKKENVSSCKLAIALGFELEDKENETGYIIGRLKSSK